MWILSLLWLLWFLWLLLNFYTFAIIFYYLCIDRIVNLVDGMFSQLTNTAHPFGRKRGTVFDNVVSDFDWIVLAFSNTSAIDISTVLNKKNNFYGCDKKRIFPGKEISRLLFFARFIDISFFSNTMPLFSRLMNCILSRS